MGWRWVHPRTDKLYFPTRDDRVVVIDTKTDRITKVIPLDAGSRPNGVDFGGPNDEVWVNGDGDGSITVIDATTDEVMVTFDMTTMSQVGGRTPIGGASFGGGIRALDRRGPFALNPTWPTASSFCMVRRGRVLQADQPGVSPRPRLDRRRTPGASVLRVRSPRRSREDRAGSREARQGSNVFNILAIMGIAVALSPEPVQVSGRFLALDLPVMVGASLIFVSFAWLRAPIRRWAGIAFASAYAVYMIALYLVA